MPKYTYEEAFKSSLDYFNGDDLAAKVFVDKYALRNSENELLEGSPTDMHWRLANEFARIEEQKFKNPLSKEDIFKYLDKFKYIVPQGSPMSGIGDNYRVVTLSNCYVVPTWDSYNGICLTDSYIANISKRRGGVGWDISSLRPKGMIVQNCARTTTGAISFMERFSNTGREVGQNNRRAALMITISVHHPDIEEFIDIKKDLKKVTGANISVRLSDEFLTAVKENKEYELRWPTEGKKQVSKLIDANYIWDKIIQSAHNMAEPGLLFWDNIIKESPADCYSDFKTTSTNPCSELPLSNYDSCRLLCLNLFSYVEEPYTSNAWFNYNKLYEHAQIAQRLMDDIVDLELEKIDKVLDKIESDIEPDFVKYNEIELWHRIRETCEEGRRTGTGITALGDAIAALGLKYGRKKSIEVAEKIYQTIKFGCYRSSVDLAKELTHFKVWDSKLEDNCPFFERMSNETIYLNTVKDVVKGYEIVEDMKKYGRRNISLLTIAPTGTVSTQTQTSSGVEPVFMLSYTRRKKITHDDKESKVDFVDDIGDKWQEFEVYHHGLKLWMDKNPDKKIEDSPYHGSCAEELDWQSRVQLQAAIQKHCDHSISSTINLPEDVTVDEVKKIYEYAWKYGLKGITVYRKNCRSGVLVEKKSKIKKTQAPKRPKELECDIHHITVKGQPYFVLIGLFEDEPYEVFAGKGNFINKNSKKGTLIKFKRPKYYKAVLDDGFELAPVTIGCDDAEESLTRMVSLGLRHGADIKFVVEQLEKVNGDMTCFAKSIARALKKYIPNGTKSNLECESCQQKTLVRQEGCLTCQSCGWSKCL